MKRLRILLAEDDVIIGDLLAELLTDMNHDVCAVVTTERAAIRAAARHAPELLILDVNLGSGSGVRALAEILRSGPVPHIMMSGSTRPSDAATLFKPFREADLVRAIDAALAKADVATALRRSITVPIVGAARPT